jgi:SCP-2 sterol transfer family
VARFLSDEWFDQAGALGTEAASLLPEATVVLQHTVSGSPAGDVCYHLRLAEHAAEIVRGPSSHPDVTFAEDYATAAAVASGEVSAPAALLAGRIRVGGDMAALVAHQSIISGNDPLSAAVREATTY